VKKRQRRVCEVDQIVLPLYAKGLTTGEISAHFAEIHGASVSKETVSRITDRVVVEMQAWATRPLDRVYAAVFVDAVVVKVRDGQVGNRPMYAAHRCHSRGRPGHPGVVRRQCRRWEGATRTAAWRGVMTCVPTFWMAVLTDLRNRNTKDTFYVVCDG
jgi:putative transposase